MHHHRRAERADLRRRLLSGASILMLAPRRIGKTWLIRKIDEDMAAQGWLTIRIDVEGKRTEEDFLREICGAIERKQGLGKRMLAHLGQRFRQIATDTKGGNLHEAIGKIDPRSFLETLVESLGGEETRTLIIIDEIALFVLELARQDPAAATALLYHLRKLQQSYPKVQWFLTGSVGLDVVARRHGITGALLDYDSFPLAPFSPEAARSYVAELCETAVVPQPFELDDAAFQQVMDELGWLSPYYLRQLALLIEPSEPARASGERAAATAADVRNAATALLSPQRRMHFAAWQEHIVKNFTKEESARLSAILDILSGNPAGEIEATLLTRVQQTGSPIPMNGLKEALHNLGNDGYLMRVDQRWLFQSALLRRFWQEYMVQ